MEKHRRQKRYHRGRRKQNRAGANIFSTIVLIIAIGVFAVSGYQLYQIYSEYDEGEKEYTKIQEIAMQGDEQEGFNVDFDALKEINEDVIAWIRFEEPAEINYPVVQGEDNDKYLTKTFEVNTNKLGTIFVDKDNSDDFTDRNTIMYGHNMKNKTMFAQLLKYKDQKFWEENPYFFIYTPDGMEHMYKIYFAGVVKDTSKSYTMSFATDEEFEQYIKDTKEASAYETDVELDKDSKIISLSTCTNVRDDERFLVQGVRVRTKKAGK